MIFCRHFLICFANSASETDEGRSATHFFYKYALETFPPHPSGFRRPPFPPRGRLSLFIGFPLGGSCRASARLMRGFMHRIFLQARSCGVFTSSERLRRPPSPHMGRLSFSQGFPPTGEAVERQRD